MAEPIYRTVYEIEVFSRGPFQRPPSEGIEDPFDLSYINYAITEGDCIGNVDVISTEVVPPHLVEENLLRIGNDGTFFAEEDIWDEDEEGGS